MRFRSFLKIALVSTLICYGHTLLAQKTKHAITDSDAFGKDPKENLIEGKIIEAGKYLMLDDFKSAVNAYNDVLKVDPKNDAAHFQLAKIDLFQLKNVDDALTQIKAAYKIDPKNKWYAQLYAHVYEEKGDFKSACSILSDYVSKFPDDDEQLFKLAYYQSRTGKYPDAIASLNKLEVRNGVTEDFSEQKEKLFLLEGKTDKAAEELQRLINAYPNEPRYYNLLAELYFTHSMNEEGFGVVKKLIDIDPNNPHAQLMLADYYRSKNDMSSTFEALEKAFQNPSLDVEAEMQILYSVSGGIGHDKKFDEQLVELATLAASNHPDEPKPFAMLGDFQSKLNLFTDAEKNYRQSVKLGSNKFSVWQQLMLTEATLNHFDSLLVSSAEAMELFPDQPLPYYFNGAARMQKKQYAEALKSFSTSLKIGLENKKLIEQIYSQMGDAYNELGNYASSDSCFDVALSISPDDANTLNNYAYYLSLRNEKLDKAEMMSKQSNEISPSNRNYIDTYAWVFYHEGKYNDAKSWEEKAIQLGADKNPDVLEHYGDILFHLGDTEGAISNWKKAQMFNPDSTRLGKKIADKKLYE